MGFSAHPILRANQSTGFFKFSPIYFIHWFITSWISKSEIIICVSRLSYHACLKNEIATLISAQCTICALSCQLSFINTTIEADWKWTGELWTGNSSHIAIIYKYMFRLLCNVMTRQHILVVTSYLFQFHMHCNKCPHVKVKYARHKPWWLWESDGNDWLTHIVLALKNS